MKDFLNPIEIFKIGAKIAQAFTADTTKTVTSNAHGLSNGDVVRLTTATTLPAGFDVLTDYFVKNVTTNTFELALTPEGTSITTTDAGTGTHTYTLQGKKIFVKDYDNLELDIFTLNSANLTLKVLKSNSESVDFNSAASPTNPWDYVEIIEDDNEDQTAGSTGFSVTGSDDNKTLEINTNHSAWITVQCTSYTAGNVSVVLSGASD